MTIEPLRVCDRRSACELPKPSASAEAQYIDAATVRARVEAAIGVE